MRFLTFLSGLTLVLLFFPSPLLAQELHEDLQGVWKAQVIEVISEEEVEVPGTDATSLVQELIVRPTEGIKEGEELQITNDRLRLGVGDTFYLNYLITLDGVEIYSVRDANRIPSLVLLALLFVVAVIAFGGKQGVRSLVSLASSFAAILFVLLPLLRAGYSPVLVSVSIATLILFFAIFFTHGFNRAALIAFVGTVSAVVFTGLLASYAVGAAKLSGISSDEAVFLNFATHGSLDFQGLLLGGIIIGVLGVLDDIAITQVAVVSELKAAGVSSVKELVARAIRVGREHVGALVNTLVLAYASVSLPLLLLFTGTDASFTTIINQEIFATEIARTIVGSIGLILTVPISTYLAARFVKPGSIHHHHSH